MYIDQPNQNAQVSCFFHIFHIRPSIPGLNKLVSPPDVTFRHLFQAVIHVCHMVWTYRRMDQCEALVQEGFNISDLV